MSLESELISQYGYAAVLLGSLIEGDGVAIVGGIASRHGYISFGLTVLAAAIGGMLGDQILYFVGRVHGNRVIKKLDNFRDRIEQVRGLVRRHENLCVVGVRFAYGFRLIGPLIIGSSGVGIARFFFLNLIGAVLWASIMVGVGFGVGEFLHHFVEGHKRLEIWLGITVVCVLLLSAAVRLMLSRRGR